MPLSYFLLDSQTEQKKTWWPFLPLQDIYEARHKVAKTFMKSPNFDEKLFQIRTFFYRFIFLRSIMQFFTQIYINCIVSSWEQTG